MSLAAYISSQATLITGPPALFPYGACVPGGASWPFGISPPPASLDACLNSVALPLCSTAYQLCVDTELASALVPLEALTAAVDSFFVVTSAALVFFSE